MTNSTAGAFLTLVYYYSFFPEFENICTELFDSAVSCLIYQTYIVILTNKFNNLNTFLTSDDIRKNRCKVTDFGAAVDWRLLIDVD